MARVEGVGAVEDTKVVGDAFLLDVGVLATPFDPGRRQVGRGGTVAAEAARLRKAALQAGQIGRVEDEALQRDPAAFEADLDPAVDDALRRQPVGEAGDRALLQGLVDREAVESARDAHRAQQGHQQRALGVALADAISQHAGCWQLVALVVAEGDLVADEVVDGADAVVGAQGAPAAGSDQRLDVRVVDIQQRRRGQQGVHGVGHGVAPLRRVPAPGEARPGPAG